MIYVLRDWRLNKYNTHIINNTVQTHARVTKKIIIFFFNECSSDHSSLGKNTYHVALRIYDYIFDVSWRK